MHRVLDHKGPAKSLLRHFAILMLLLARQGRRCWPVAGPPSGAATALRAANAGNDEMGPIERRGHKGIVSAGYLSSGSELQRRTRKAREPGTSGRAPPVATPSTNFGSSCTPVRIWKFARCVTSQFPTAASSRKQKSQASLKNQTKRRSRSQANVNYRFPLNSLLKNYGYRRFFKNPAPTMRDKGEYPRESSSYFDGPPGAACVVRSPLSAKTNFNPICSGDSRG